ncbi:hypothetical protein [Schaalia sp. JY-X159]|uniref:hypothetical protein n=1 Tax=Schaalia sp. JY-X159 TaxID=2758575 RepID=UPI00165DA7A1|nr:hypothetical protein [Schaalia sp. JY-X159]
MQKVNSALLVTGVIVVAGLAVGSAIDRALPSAQDVLSEPFVTTIEVGQKAELRTADITVDSWTTSDSVTSYGTVYDTVGTWVVLDLHVTAKNRPHTLAGMELVSEGGRTYGGPADIPNGCDPAQPGVPITCQVAFEVPSEDVPGLELHIPAGGVSGSPGDDLAIVDLGIVPDAPSVTSRLSTVDLVRTQFGATS